MKRILTVLAATLLLTAAILRLFLRLRCGGIVRHRRVPGHRRRL